MLSSLRVEHAVFVPKATGMQLLFGSEQPRRASLWGTRGLLTTIRRGERALLIDEFSALSNDRPAVARQGC